MEKMAGLLTKLCEKPAPDERPQGLKRQSTSAVSDNSHSEPEENSHKSGKRRRHLSLSYDNISLHASDDLDEANAHHRVLKGHRPKRAGNPRQGDTYSFSKTKQRALRRMTPPATKSRKSWLILR